MRLKLEKPLEKWHVTQGFGENKVDFYEKIGLKGHNGIDLRAPDGTPVYASHDGRVTYAGYDGSGGLTIVIRTEKELTDVNGEPKFWKTIYCHLKKDSIKVTGGQTVKVGELIALADNTGRSTGSHLHFALKPIYRGEEDWQWANLEQNNGYMGAVDPMPYLDITKFVFTSLLKIGSKGEEVLELQILLNEQGAYLVEDGKFGQKTQNVLKTYQARNGLVADGIVGPKTRTVLNK